MRRADQSPRGVAFFQYSITVAQGKGVADEFVHVAVPTGLL
ncbi:MAG: hypothetical protein RL538_787 [Candidatus Parcubacteria bacterium]|jgi:hypothetical protein